MGLPFFLCFSHGVQGFDFAFGGQGREGKKFEGQEPRCCWYRVVALVKIRSAGHPPESRALLSYAFAC